MPPASGLHLLPQFSSHDELHQKMVVPVRTSTKECCSKARYLSQVVSIALMASASPSFPPECLTAAATPPLKAAVHERLRQGHCRVSVLSSIAQGLARRLFSGSGDFSRRFPQSSTVVHIAPVTGRAEDWRGLVA